MTPAEQNKLLKAFFNAIPLQDAGAPSQSAGGHYVPGLHRTDGRDPMAELASAIDFQETGQSYLFTGHRGAGKTVELKQLVLRLEQDFGCTALYADMGDYVQETEPIGTADLLASLMGALSEAFDRRYSANPLNEGYWARFIRFLTETKVEIPEIKASAGAFDVKAALKSNPSFKQRVQSALDARLQDFVKDARDFAGAVVTGVRAREGDPARKVVLIADSLERIRGAGAKAEGVYASFSETFFGNAAQLRFNLLHVVYSVPPILPLIAPGIGALYGGGVFGLPQVKVEATPPEASAGGIQARAPHDRGIELLASLVTSRFPDWNKVFSEPQLRRLARNSGGNIRIFFSLIGRVLLKARLADLPLADDLLIDYAESDLRAEMPLTDQDREWLLRVAANHRMGLDDHRNLAALARLFDNHLILDYRNGRPWYDVLPLVRAGLEAAG